VSALRLAELAPRELDARIAEVPALILPVGTIEWHSHHLPVGLDGLKAEAIAAGAAELTGAMLAPTCWWAADGVPFPYTLRLAPEPVEALLGAALLQFAGMGFRALLVVNGHYGLANSRAVRAAALRCMDATPATVLAVADYEALTRLGNRGDHAGVWESSLLWARRPDLVHLDAVAPGEPLPGVIGDDPRGLASERLGEEGIAAATAGLAAALRRALTDGPADRARYVRALRAGQAALDRTAELRAELPRDRVPPVLTPAWAAHLEALLDGRYDDAAAHACRKAADLAR
jgi:creatinine amidohydrolase